MSKIKISIMILAIPLLIVGAFYVRFASLSLYTYTDTNTLTHGDYTYVGGHETYKDYYDYTGARKFTLEKEIGRTNNSSFFGFKETVWKLEGKPADEVVFVKGLMFEDVLKVKSPN